MCDNTQSGVMVLCLQSRWLQGCISGEWKDALSNSNNVSGYHHHSSVCDSALRDHDRGSDRSCDNADLEFSRWIGQYRRGWACGAGLFDHTDPTEAGGENLEGGVRAGGGPVTRGSEERW